VTSRPPGTDDPTSRSGGRKKEEKPTLFANNHAPKGGSIPRLKVAPFLTPVDNILDIQLGDLLLTLASGSGFAALGSLLFIRRFRSSSIFAS